MLRELGYTLGQGYHLARPMTADGVSRLLAASRRWRRPTAKGHISNCDCTTHPYPVSSAMDHKLAGHSLTLTSANIRPCDCRVWTSLLV